VSRSARRLLTLAVLLAAMVVGPPAGAEAAPAAQPSVTVDRAAMRPGETVVVTLDGWQAEVITLSVCGNRAARGSSDCNMVASEGIRRNRDGSLTHRDFAVSAPSTTCPCVLRASTTTNDEVAVAPIELLGHPTGPVVPPKGGPRLDVTVRAARAPRGLVSRVRAALGGPTAYDVTVTVRNPTTLQIDHVALAASARGGRGDVETIELPEVGPLGPGRSWTRTVRSTVPAPVIGTFRWEVTASGAGRAVTARTEAGSLPIALIVLLLVLAADIAAIVWRRTARRRSQAYETGSTPSDERSSRTRRSISSRIGRTASTS
jgi:hypothetical protein